MAAETTVPPVIDGPARVDAPPPTGGDWCHMPDRSKLEEGTYLIYEGAPGTTRWTVSPCGPGPAEEAPVTTVAAPVAAPVATVAVRPAEPVMLPATGNETAGIAMIGTLLLLFGFFLKKVAS